MFSGPNWHKYQMRLALYEEWEEINLMIWVCIGLISAVIIWYHHVIFVNLGTAPRVKTKIVKIERSVLPDKLTFYTKHVLFML
jgi:hypothetical protein